ncbi:Cyclic nucleotide-gated cation channel beta-3 [Liparis tanakae]|uniref:Cyclic nucleotide-gated cation channel beta-3 n=1 Tax=Liparis tanakae TaxID=230148 RepID=A0A4Z2I2R5_9TELE|nr:Cyclic nucleotide-gated cation channel beta-3 [Liparis tanakae]
MKTYGLFHHAATRRHGNELSFRPGVTIPVIQVVPCAGMDTSPEGIPKLPNVHQERKSRGMDWVHGSNFRTFCSAGGPERLMRRPIPPGPKPHCCDSGSHTSQWSLRTLGGASRPPAESSPVCIAAAFRWLFPRLTRGPEWVMIVGLLGGPKVPEAPGNPDPAPAPVPAPGNPDPVPAPAPAPGNPDPAPAPAKNRHRLRLQVQVQVQVQTLLQNQTLQQLQLTLIKLGLRAPRVHQLCRQESAPSPSTPIIINKYSDQELRAIVVTMSERVAFYKEKVIDQYASSPEISPPVTPLLRREHHAKVLEERKRQAEEDRIKKEEADQKKKEEQEKKKKEAEQKKKEDEEKKLLEAKEEKKEEKDLKTKLKEAAWYSVDTMLNPFEALMDLVLGNTIDPFTDRRYIAWLSLVTLAFNYNTWFLTARLCFPYHNESAIPYWFAMDTLADIIYLTDSVFFQARKQFVKGGDIIKDRRVTKINYRESERFLLDTFSTLPFDLLYFQFGFKSIFRFNRLLKVDTFFEFSDRLESLMAKAYIWRVIRTIGYLLFMLHINACLYYVASAYQGLGGTKWVYSGLGSAYLSCFFYAEKSLLLIADLPFPDTMYLRCYYYAVRSLINIGGLNEPHTVFEITFQMTNFFVGVFVFSSLIGQMRDVIGAATAGQTYFRSSRDGTVDYMVNNHIPPMVQNRVRSWYTYTWDAQGMLDESELLDKMPLVMRTAIAVDINLSTFQKIALFQGCDQQMLVDMLLRLKSIVYLPGDFVVKKGDIGKEMYVIKSGAVQVVGGPDNSIVFVTLKAGCVFGEISLLQSSKDGGNRRTANVKAHGFANLFVLEKKDLFDILVHYPESQKVLARKGKKLMKAKGPAAAKVEEEKKKGLALFGPKPPTPKLLRAFGGNFNILKKMKTAAGGQ